MQEIIDFLGQHKYGSLATSVDGQPYIRPFEFGFATDEGMFFYTSDDKAVYSQLKSNPRASFCSTDEDLTYVQLTGNIEFTEKEEYKDTMIHKSVNAQKIYKTPDNHLFKVFYMPHGRAMMHRYEKGYIKDEKF